MGCEKKKPNRTRPRVFKARDVGRIASYCYGDGGIKPQIIAYTLVYLGYSAMFKTMAESVDRVSLALSFLVKIAGVTAITKVLDVLTSIFSSGYYKKIPKWNLLGLVVVIAIAVIEKITKLVGELLGDISNINAASVLARSIVFYIEQIEEEVGTNGTIN